MTQPDSRAHIDRFLSGRLCNGQTTLTTPLFSSLRIRRILGLLGLILATMAGGQAIAAPIDITLVFDGPGRTDALIEQAVQKEILALTEGEMEIRFTDPIHGDWTADGVKEAVDRALSDPETEMVLTFGVLASDAACRRGALPKPTVAAAVLDADSQGLPSEGLASGVDGLVYIELPQTTVDELKTFYRVVAFKKIAFLGNQALVEGLPELFRLVEEETASLGLEVQMVAVGHSAREAFDRIAPDVDAVYLWPQFQLSSEQFRALIEGLIERGLPSFSALGGLEVEAGLLAGQRSSNLIDRLARRAALNVQRILLGEPAAEIPVALTLRSDLTINMATARRLDITPRWETLIEARLVGLDQLDQGPGTRLAEAVQQAVEQNLDLAVKRRALAAAQQNIEIARASWRPQLSVDLSSLRIDDDRAAASFGSQAEQSSKLGLTASQLLVSDGARAQVEVEGHLLAIDEASVETTRLDIALDSAVTYLNLLRAQTLQRIQRNNLELTRSNLELAEVRRQVGTANPAEIYRWQSQIAQDRQALVGAAADVQVARLALNRLLHQPLEQEIQTVEVGLDDRDLLIDLEAFQGFIATPKHFRLVREFTVNQGLERSPELAAVRRQVEVRQRLATASRRAFYWPTVAAQFSLEHLLDESGAGTEGGASPGAVVANDTDWSLGLNASLPLYVGGQRRAERIQAEQNLAQAELDLESARERLEQNIRAGSIRARTSFFSIHLADESAAAAKQSLELVADAYARGAVSILDLLDAQNAALNASLAAADSVYDFFINLLTLERSAGFFYLLENPESRAQWIHDLTIYFMNAEVEPWSPSPLDR